MSPADAMALAALLSLIASLIAGLVRGLRHAVAVERRYIQHLKESRP